MAAQEPQEPVPPPPPLENIPTVEMPVVGGETPPPQETPPQAPPPAPKPSKLPRIPLKPLLVGVAALLLLGGLVFAVRNLVFKEKEPEIVTLTYWGLWEDSSVLEGAIRDFETQQSGNKDKQIKIEYIKQSKEDYRERLVNSLAKGEGPDIFRFHNTWVPMLSAQLEPIPPDIMDAQTYQQTFYPVAGSTLRSGASLVGIPLMYDGLGLYLNEELFAAFGKSPPKTWDEFRGIARELTVKDEQGKIQQAGAAMGRTDNLDHWQDILSLMLSQNGADLANPTGKLAEEALRFFTVFAAVDKVWDGTLPPSTVAFASGKLGMYFGPSWKAFEIKARNPALRFKVIPVPQLPKSSPTDKDITWASFWAEGVWTRSQHKQEAWQFLLFLSSKTTLQKMYQQSASTRLFGPPYPRPDMATLLENDPIVGAYIKQAPSARSWYLTSRTFDGPTGINTRISGYFADAVNGMVEGNRDPEDALKTAADGVRQVLTGYNLTR